MECSICNYDFIIPKSQEDLDQLREKYEKEYGKFKFLTMLILPKSKPEKMCSNESCSALICQDCREEDKTRRELFKCYFCRCYDYKYFLQTVVLRDLQIKVLGKKGFEVWYHECIETMEK